LTPVLQEKGRLDEWIRELDELREGKDNLEAWLQLAEEEGSEEEDSEEDEMPSPPKPPKLPDLPPPPPGN